LSGKSKAKTSPVKANHAAISEFLFLDLAEPSLPTSVIKMEIKLNNNKSEVLCEAILTAIDHIPKETFVAKEPLEMARYVKKSKVW